MAKNHHRIQNRSKHQPQISSFSSPLASSLGGGVDSNSAANMPLTEDLDEDDIRLCPTCLGECDCDTRDSRPRTSSINYSSTTSYGQQDSNISQAVVTDASVISLPAPTNGTGAPSLKIKLTVPPSLQAKAKAVPSRTQQLKQSKSLQETTYDSGVAVGTAANPSFSLPGRPLAESQSDASAPKKRGRPSKAAIAARDVNKAGPSGSNTRGYGTTKSMASTSRQYAAARGAAISKKGSLPKTSPKRRTQAVSKARARKQQRISNYMDESFSEDDNTNDFSMNTDGEHDETDSIQFPTFISAASSSSNSSSSDSESELSELTEDGSETTHKLRHESTEDLKIKNEAWVDKEKHDSIKTPRNNWEIRPRKKSIGLDGKSDTEMETDSGEETEDGEAEEDEDEEEDEEDEDIAAENKTTYTGFATGWTDDEDSFDADLFFANLSDSSSDESDDRAAEAEQRVHAEMETDMDALSIQEAAAAGFMAPFAELQRQGLGEISFDLTENWDGQFVFGSGSKNWETILDLSFETASFNADHRQRPQFANQETLPAPTSGDETTATTAEAETAEDDEYVTDDSDGETTEDEFVIDLNGLPAPRNLALLQFPGSVGTVDPMSTYSPCESPTHRPRQLGGGLEPCTPLDSPRPADILSGKFFFGKNTLKPTTANSTASSPVKSQPRMGVFNTREVDSTKKVIVSDKAKQLPSPFPSIRRLRRRSSSWHSRKKSLSGSDHMSSGSRPSSLLGQRRPFQAQDIDVVMEPTSPDLPPAQPIDLDDVLDSAYLASDPPETSSSALSNDELDPELRKGLQALTRWERIPVDSFRRTLFGGNTDHAVRGWRRPQTADGISYGSPAGGMMRAHPFNSALWEVGGEVSVDNSRSKPAYFPVPISPVILPLRDGERTPTGLLNQQSSPNHDHHYTQQQLYGHAQNIKSRKELRQEKKRKWKMSTAASALQRHHYPNSKSRSAGSMQRNHGLSSVPPLTL